MSGVEIRPFHRRDRDQVTALVDAHVQAVIPGATVSVNAVLSQLEREPGEFVVDAWVRERATLVASRRDRVVAAAHLLLFSRGDDVAPDYRGLGEIRWFVCAVDAPFWPDASEAGAALVRAAVQWLRAHGADAIATDGSLPAPGVFGVPDCWPHVARAFRAAGLTPTGRREHVAVLAATSVARPAPHDAAPAIERTVGATGTRFAAVVDGAVAGHVEVDVRTSDPGAAARRQGWADIGSLHVEPAMRRRGLGRALLVAAVDWLQLGHVDRLLAYCDVQDEQTWAFLDRVGFQRLVTTTRGWRLPDESPVAGAAVRDAAHG